jgi:hypothetical protein
MPGCKYGFNSVGDKEAKIFQKGQMPWEGTDSRVGKDEKLEIDNIQFIR